ncbi:MAG: DUF3592 domain-containing protein, partial [Anaerolinea sp.]|nr:DUF3592 domain-containing protein [Anaerolinea sp.]
MLNTKVFLAEPKNAGLLTGQKSRIGSSIIMWLVALIAIAVAVGAGWFTYTTYTQYNALMNNDVTARGTIIDGFDETTRSYVVIETHRYNVTVRFTVDGVRYEFGQDIDAALYNDLFIDARVEVAYLPENPNVAALAGADRDDTDFRNRMIAFSVVTGIAVLVAVFMIVTDARNRRLSRRGDLLDGQLVRATGNYYRRRLNVTFEYAFRSPQGTELR